MVQKPGLYEIQHHDPHIDTRRGRLFSEFALLGTSPPKESVGLSQSALCSHCKAHASGAMSLWTASCFKRRNLEGLTFAEFQ
jgi:hypothetical protein